jgi:hypothetical protein
VPPPSPAEELSAPSVGRTPVFLASSRLRWRTSSRSTRSRHCSSSWRSDSCKAWSVELVALLRCAGGRVALRSLMRSRALFQERRASASLF